MAMRTKPTILGSISVSCAGLGVALTAPVHVVAMTGPLCTVTGSENDMPAGRNASFYEGKSLGKPGLRKHNLKESKPRRDWSMSLANSGSLIWKNGVCFGCHLRITEINAES